MAGQKTDTFLNKLYVFFVKNGQKLKKINNKNKYNSEMRCFIINGRDRTEIKIKNKKNVYVFILVLLIPFAVFFSIPKCNVCTRTFNKSRVYLLDQLPFENIRK